MTKKKPRQKLWSKMTSDELAEATKQFDKPMRFEETKPLTPEQQKDWEKSRRGPVYSVRVYDGKKATLHIEVEESLLKQFDEFTRRNKMTREEFVARTLRGALALVDSR